MNELNSLLPVATKEPHSITVVRLTTTYWYDNNGMYSKQTLRFLKRKISGYNWITEDLAAIGADEVMPKIINLSKCEDGVYQVVTCNERHDWETPHIIDEYDYKLVPYIEPTKT